MIRLCATTKNDPQATGAWIGVKHPLGPDGVFWFRYEAGTKWAAHLLVQELTQRLDERMTAIRKEEYLRGWKDAKAKGAKVQWFSGELP